MLGILACNLDLLHCTGLVFSKNWRDTDFCCCDEEDWRQGGKINLLKQSTVENSWTSLVFKTIGEQGQGWYSTPWLNIHFFKKECNITFLALLATQVFDGANVHFFLREIFLLNGTKFLSEEGGCAGRDTPIRGICCQESQFLWWGPISTLNLYLLSLCTFPILISNVWAQRGLLHLMSLNSRSTCFWVHNPYHRWMN